ncbi:hypothetical protein GBAR_LOCUS15848, partial [Geodia barretti]
MRAVFFNSVRLQVQGVRKARIELGVGDTGFGTRAYRLLSSATRETQWLHSTYRWQTLTDRRLEISKSIDAKAPAHPSFTFSEQLGDVTAKAMDHLFVLKLLDIQIAI